MPKPESKGPPAHVIEDLVAVHQRNGTLEKLLDSGIGGQVEEVLATQTAFLTAYTAAYGIEPWAWDGESLAMLGDIEPGQGNSWSSNFVALGDTIYFTAYTASGPSINGGIWSYSGPGSVEFVSDLGQTSTFYEFGGNLYFGGYEPQSGTHGLWTISGSTGDISLVEDVHEGPALSFPGNFVTFDGDLYFSAYTPDTGHELWKMDDATGDVTLAADIISGTGSSGPGNLTAFNGSLYFSANSGSGMALWKMSAEGALELVENISADYLTEFNGDLYFRGADPQTQTGGLWKVEGESGIASMVSDLNPVNTWSLPDTLTVLNGDMYFRSSSYELWKLEGDTGAVETVAGFDGIAGKVTAARFAVFDGDLYFEGERNDVGTELFKLDGETGEIAVFDFYGGSTYDRSGHLFLSTPGEGSGAKVIGAVNGSIAVAAWVDTDSDGTADRYAMLAAKGEPDSVEDFSIVDDGSGTFMPIGSLYVTDFLMS